MIGRTAMNVLRKQSLAHNFGRFLAGNRDRTVIRRLQRDFNILLSDDGFDRFRRKKTGKSEEPSKENKDGNSEEGKKDEEKAENEEGKKQPNEQDLNKKIEEEKIRLEELKNKIQEELNKYRKNSNKRENQSVGGGSESDQKEEQKKEQTNPSNNPQPPNRKQPSPALNFLVGAFLAFLVLSILGSEDQSPIDITIDQFFQDFLRNKKVQNMIITRIAKSEESLEYRVKFSTPEQPHGYKFDIKNLEEFLLQIINALGPDEQPVPYTVETNVPNDVRSELSRRFTGALTSIFIFGVFIMILRPVIRQGFNSMQRQNRFDEKNNAFIARLRKEVQKRGTATKVKFEDVAGMEEAKKEITEFVDFLTNKEQFVRLGAKIPRGALLTGPPGTGKTLLAKACANESNVPFISVTGSEFVEVIVGVGASRVRSLFEIAKENAPCIIFIDEIDAIAKSRSSGRGSINEERQNTLNQLLVEMDGFGSQTNIIVFAATNLKDSLDPAILRPGRFDRIIDIPLPDIEARKKIFLIHLKKIVLDSTKKAEDYANRLATLTPGFSGAQIENICNEAAIIAARKEAVHVDVVDFEKAVERVIAGLEKTTKLDREEKTLTAIHEAGKAVVSWFLKNGPPILKLTVVPRSKGAKGFSQYLANENLLNTKQDLIDLICISLAGTLTEEILLGKRTTSASADLHRVNTLAHQLTTTFGMSKLGPLHRFENEYGFKSYSEAVNFEIDQEKLSIVKECEEKTRNLIEEKKDLIKSLSDALMQRETLNFQDIKDLLGNRPYPPKGSYKQYLDEIASTGDDQEKAKAGRLEDPDEPKAVAEPIPERLNE